MLDDNNQMRIRFEQTARKLELILASTGEGILGLDSEGRHTFVNAQALKMLEYKRIKCKPLVSAVMPLADVQQAFDSLYQGKNTLVMLKP